MNFHEVHLWPSKKTIRVYEDETVLESCRRQGVDIKSKCGGVASCADCVCKVTSGDNHLSPMEFSELRLLGNVFHLTKERLTCQLKVTGDITLDISAHLGGFAQEPMGEKKVIRRRKAPPTKEPELVMSEGESQDSAIKPKKLGGGKRPRKFKYSE